MSTYDASETGRTGGGGVGCNKVHNIIMTTVCRSLNFNEYYSTLNEWNDIISFVCWFFFTVSTRLKPTYTDIKHMHGITIIVTNTHGRLYKHTKPLYLVQFEFQKSVILSYVVTRERLTLRTCAVFCLIIPILFSRSHFGARSTHFFVWLRSFYIRFSLYITTTTNAHNRRKMQIYRSQWNIFQLPS